MHNVQFSCKTKSNKLQRKAKQKMQTHNPNEKQPIIAIVMVPLPAQGHLNQLLHLSQLISSYGLPVHFVGSSTHNNQAKIRLHGWDPQTITRIHFHDFELPPYNSPLPNIDPSTPFPCHLIPLFETSTKYLQQPVTNLLNQLSSKVKKVIVIHDVLMTSTVQDAKHISNIETYIFIPTSIFTSFMDVWQEIPYNYKPFELDNELNDISESLPAKEGCIPQNVKEFANHQTKLFGFESGWIYNTCRVIEGKLVDLFEKLSSKSQIKHFAIGPFNPVDVKCGQRKSKHECLEWLDKQKEGSVIYVSFGTATSLKDEQIIELAIGLENCRMKFIWVLRRADNIDVFVDGDKVQKPQLPQGYEERVKDRGIIVRDWAPQLEILGHASIGGFMSHCGWNSCMESISMGVPIAAWPMHSDQPRNATLVSKFLKIGIMVRDWEHCGELVKSSTIENAIKTLMEGHEIKKRAKELGEVVRGSMSKGGLSCLERNSFIAHICR